MVLASRDVIGRREELGAVQRFLERVAGGLAGLVLDGVAGIGKTTILDACTAAAISAGYRVLRARPAESERELTLASLTDLFATVGDHDLAVLPPPQRRALEVALLQAEPSGAPIDQRTLSVAVTGLLRELARPGAPVLVAIDDAQWLDDSCRSILAYAVRRLDGEPIGFVMSVRGGEPIPATARNLLAALPVDRTERLVVGPMPLASLHRLFMERLGRSFSRVGLVRIEQASGGNPFYAMEIARALLGTEASLAPGEPLPIPETLGGLVSARIGAFPPATRRALLLAAAAAEPTLAALRRVDPGLIEALDPAIADGLVLVDGASVRFAHPLLAQGVIASVGEAELRAVHAALAPAMSSDDARARHAGQAAAAPGDAVAADLESAAAAARSRGATLDAAALYEHASHLTPDASPDEVMRRARLAAECLFLDVSEVVEADAILARGLPRARPGPARAEALGLRAIIWYYHGRVPESVALAEGALDEAGSDPILRARLLVRLSFLRSQLDAEAGLGPAEEAVALLERSGIGRNEPDLLANAVLMRASLQLALVHSFDERSIEEGERLITPDGRSWERENADGLVFGLARQTDDLDRAIAMTRELIRSKSGAGGDDPFNLVQLSGLLCLRGELAEAREVAEAAMEGYDREGSHLMPSWRLRGVALVAAHDGRTEEARRLATEGLELALAEGNLVLATFHHHILGFVALSLGDFASADASLGAASELAERTATRFPGRFKLDGDRLEAALAMGRVDDAAGIVAGLERAMQVVPTPWVTAIGLRCRGLLEAARGEPESAIIALDRALAAHDALPMPFERARTLLAKGQVHRRRKEKRLADVALREALAQFEGLGTPLWADRARAELARVGRRPSAPDALTPTERQVAELAASGLPNARIAEVAFLSPKTVGNVLGRVYQKLRIHSRAELGAIMAQDQGGSTSPDT